MDPESVMAADGIDSALANGAFALENASTKGNGVASGETLDTTSESQNENSGNSSSLDASEHPTEAAEGTQVGNVDDSKFMKGQKAQQKLKHEKPKPIAGKNVPSVSVKKNKGSKNADAKVAAPNGSVAPDTHIAKSLKSSSLNGKDVPTVKQRKHDPVAAESAGDKMKAKPLKKQAHDTSEDDTQSSNSPKADDGKPRKVGALPNYGFSFKCDQRAEKRREFYYKLEEKTHAKEEEINNMQAKSKETQEAELRMLRKSLNFKATPMPSFYQEPQPPKTELKKIPPTRPKSPKLGRKKTASGADSEEPETPRISRLSLDERVSKENPGVKGITSVDPKKPPVRRSLPRLPSQKTALPEGKNEGKAIISTKATTATAKAKPERKKVEKDAVASSLEDQEPAAVGSTADDAEPEDSHEQSPTLNEERVESIVVVSEAVAVEH